ncbi:ribonuclease III [Dechloromonas denitrificans]|jgi:ribonuclease-3|uniref:ribonuclease III n=1 Tax=Azonexaceae TaxID=2008795 RepID=UPI001CF8620D|nr:ribonuclease III [Dechloromonas denitrificans]UCV01759.1 ribonuclease III [Dechloromonas denitrificans]UCV06109.1 ribonuclease III [Dechloromonas denitrificans]
MTAQSVANTLGHCFSDQTLLRTALTHRSFGTPNNERLEFLGDGILDCVIAAALFHRFPDFPEGDLSRLRANLVRQDALHRLALSLDIGGCLRLGEGELKSGGAQRPSILADALEALFGAIYLDAGFDAAYAVIIKLYTPLLDELRPGQVQKDAKTSLQEWLQGRKKPLPRYQLLEATGAAHEQRFKVACEIDHPSVRTVGYGPSRRIAEQIAAEQALKELKA